VGWKETPHLLAKEGRRERGEGSGSSSIEKIQSTTTNPDKTNLKATSGEAKAYYRMI